MQVQSALQELGHKLQRASDVLRDPSERNRYRATEDLRRARPDLLWVTLLRPGSHDPARIHQRRAEFVAALVRTQASLNGLYVVEGRTNNRAWELEAMKRVRHDLKIKPQVVRWCSLG